MLTNTIDLKVWPRVRERLSKRLGMTLESSDIDRLRVAYRRVRERLGRRTPAVDILEGIYAELSQEDGERLQQLLRDSANREQQMFHQREEPEAVEPGFGWAWTQ